MTQTARQIFCQPGTGPTVSAVGDLYRLLAGGEQTGGAYALFESVVLPGGGPPPHWHANEEESFYVIEGEITFTVNNQPVVAGAGAFLQVPRGTPHAFKNCGSTRARMLIQTAPAGFDKFMMEFARPVDSLDSAPLPVTPEEVQRLLEVAPKYGIHILPPPA